MRPTTYAGTRRGLPVLVLLLVSSACPALDSAARAGVEMRWFYHAASPQADPSISAIGEVAQHSDDEQWRLRAQLFGRFDGNDSNRSHVDAREAYVQWLGDSMQASLGLRRVFWGVTESRHLVDILNQSDFVEDLDAESKLGQPMLTVTESDAWGTLDAFLLPYFRERSFPGADGQPRVPIPIAERETEYQSAQGRHHLDYALRYSNAIGGLDFGIGWFQGTARDPRLQICFKPGSRFGNGDDAPDCAAAQAVLDARGGRNATATLTGILQQLGLAPDDASLRRQVVDDLEVVPYYDQLRQLSLDALYVTGPWALKLEALARQSRGERTHAAVAGVEYTIGQVFRTGTNLGLVAERLRDEKSDVFSARYDDEWFGGLRFGLNDRHGTTILAGVLVDASGGDRLLQIEGTRRLSEHWRLSTLVRSFDKVRGDELTGFLRNEDVLSLSLDYLW